jgi:hypothetical protein
MTTNKTTMLTGIIAIEYAESIDGTLRKHADPIESARDDLNPSEARDIAAQDASLIWCEISDADVRAIHELARQDLAGEVDDSYARTRDAEDTIRRWHDAGAANGDDDLVELIDRVGLRAAARVYSAARPEVK